MYKYFIDNKPVLPEGWALPDVLARKVSEALNKKSISPEDELVDALEDMARDIALIEPNPADWIMCIFNITKRVKILCLHQFPELANRSSYIPNNYLH